MDKPKVIIIDKNKFKYYVGTKYLNNPQQEIKTNEKKILNFIKNDFNKNIDITK